MCPHHISAEHVVPLHTRCTRNMTIVSPLLTWPDLTCDLPHMWLMWLTTSCVDLTHLTTCTTDSLHLWLTTHVTYPTSDWPDMWLTSYHTCDLPDHMCWLIRLHVDSTTVLTDLTLHVTYHTCDWLEWLTWPDMWRFRLYELTEPTLHVTYHTCDLPDLMCWLVILW